MGQLLSFAQVHPSSDGWDATEKAHLLRCVCSLRQQGVGCEAGFGIAEDGDPWFAVISSESDDTLIHVARIDGQIGVWDSASNRYLSGYDLSSLIDQVVTPQAASNDAGTPETSGNVVWLRDFLHSATAMAVLQMAWEVLRETGTIDGDQVMALAAFAEEHFPAASGEGDGLQGIMLTLETGPVEPASSQNGAEAAILADLGDLSGTMPQPMPEAPLATKPVDLAEDEENGTEPDVILDAGRGDTLPDGDGVKIAGTAGEDVIIGTAGDDTLSGGAGHDVIFGGAGDDLISGDEGDDLLIGGSGNDTLSGGDGNDALDGGVGNDVMDGGSGNDLIIIDSVGDTAIGGSGSDVFDVSGADAAGTGAIQDFTAGEDVVVSALPSMRFEGAATAGGAEVGEVADPLDLLVHLPVTIL